MVDELSSEPRSEAARAAVLMRADGIWADMCLLNVSSRGLLIQGSKVPPRGTYVEVRRGRHVIVARVVWSAESQFGVQTQDPVQVTVISNQQNIGAAASKLEPRAPSIERRAEARPPSAAEAHERSRLIGRTLEFGFMLAAVIGGAMLCVSLAGETLLRPLLELSAALH